MAQLLNQAGSLTEQLLVESRGVRRRRRSRSWLLRIALLLLRLLLRLLLLKALLLRVLLLGLLLIALLLLGRHGRHARGSMRLLLLHALLLRLVAHLHSLLRLHAHLRGLAVGLLHSQLLRLLRHASVLTEALLRLLLRLLLPQPHHRASRVRGQYRHAREVVLDAV